MCWGHTSPGLLFKHIILNRGRINDIYCKCWILSLRNISWTHAVLCRSPRHAWPCLCTELRTPTVRGKAGVRNASVCFCRETKALSLATAPQGPHCAVRATWLYKQQQDLKWWERQMPCWASRILEYWHGHCLPVSFVSVCLGAYMAMSFQRRYWKWGHRTNIVSAVNYFFSAIRCCLTKGTRAFTYWFISKSFFAEQKLTHLLM